MTWTILSTERRLGAHTLNAVVCPNDAMFESYNGELLSFHIMCVVKRTRPDILAFVIVLCGRVNEPIVSNAID